MSTQTQVLTGRIKFYNPNREFGFIRADDGYEYYFNKHSLRYPEGTEPQREDAVMFRLYDHTSGVRAGGITPAQLGTTSERFSV